MERKRPVALYDGNYLQRLQPGARDRSNASTHHLVGECCQLGHVSIDACDGRPMRRVVGVSLVGDDILLRRDNTHVVEGNIQMVPAWSCTAVADCAYDVHIHPWVGKGHLGHLVGIRIVMGEADHSAMNCAHHVQQGMEPKIRRVLA